MTPEERFERIEGVLERIAAAHLELEAAEVSQQRAHTRFVHETREGIADLREQIGNLAILVDRLIERDME